MANMNQPPYGAAQFASAASQAQGPWSLTIRQKPEKGKCVIKGKEKDRKPIDPPPILQLENRIDPTFLHNPYLFCQVHAWHETEHRPVTISDLNVTEEQELLIGQTVSSLHRLKDLDNVERGFFVFGDISLALAGRYRLRFCLWEYHLHDGQYGWAEFHTEIITPGVFEVNAAKEWEGIRESTVLSRTVADQGIKLRLRKESRHPRGRAIGNATTSNAASTSTTPIRPNPNTQGSYASMHDTNDTNEPNAKRHRSSGAESNAGGGPSSANTTPYLGSMYGGSTSGGPGYNTSYNSPPMNSQQQYGNFASSAYSAPSGYAYSPSNNYAFQQNYGMPSGSSFGGSRLPPTAGSYQSSSYGSGQSPSQFSGGYPPNPTQGSSSAYGGGRNIYPSDQQYAQRSATGQASIPTSGPHTNPSNTPHLAPIDQNQPGSAGPGQYPYRGYGGSN